jgi:hypothetical protein
VGGTTLSENLNALLAPGLGVAILSFGIGLGIERLAGARLPNALLIPLGFCGVIALLLPGYTLGAGNGLALPLVIAAALSGLAVARGGLRSRVNPGWPGLAGLAGYALVLAPEALTGHWTWSGYNFVNDTAVHMLLADHLKGWGASLGPPPLSGAAVTVRTFLSTDYPLGSHAPLAALSGLFGTRVAILYQGYLAALFAVASMALAVLSGRGWGPGWAAMAGVVAAGANLTYQYLLQGSIKEAALLAALCAGAAVAHHAIQRERPLAAAVLVSVPLAAALDVYNVVALPYVAVLAAAAGVLALVMAGLRGAPGRWRAALRPRRRWWPPLATAAGLTAILGLPALSTLTTFYQATKSAVGTGAGSATTLGQLARPLPLSQVSGVWLDGDYRDPIVPHLASILTIAATAAILVLLIPGVLRLLADREPGPLILLASVGLTLALVGPQVSPYANGKLLAIASPAVVLVAAHGTRLPWRPWAGLAGRPWAGVGVLLAAALGAAVMVSDGLAYHDAKVAPPGRMKAIEAVGHHFEGRGLLLFNEFEEFAKYFGRPARINAPFEPLTPRLAILRTPSDLYGHYYDLDLEQLSYVESFPVVVVRRSPARSRPPANYRLAYRNSFYEAWQRTAHPVVLAHLPEQSIDSAVAPAACPDLRDLAARASPGSRLLAARPPAVVSLDVVGDPQRSPGWIPKGPRSFAPDAVQATTPGYAQGTLRLAAGGIYDVWVRGDFPRPLGVSLDGRRVGAVAGVNTPGQWLSPGARALLPGPHQVRVVRGAGGLAPGTGADELIGPVALAQRGPERLESVAPSQWRSLCGRVVDWVELVRP